MRPLNDPYALRRAIPADIPAFGPIESAADTMFEPSGLLGDLSDADNVPAEVFAAGVEAGLVFTVTREGVGPVGYALCTLRKPDLYLDQLAVHPDHGRQGIGRCLVVRVFEEAEARRIRSVSLSTFRDIPWNAPFYTRLGFKILPRRKMEPWMLELEAIQAQSLDVTKRCFMRRRVRQPLFRRSGDRRD